MVLSLSAGRSGPECGRREIQRERGSSGTGPRQGRAPHRNSRTSFPPSCSPLPPPISSIVPLPARLVPSVRPPVETATGGHVAVLVSDHRKWLRERLRPRARTTYRAESALVSRRINTPGDVWDGALSVYPVGPL